jgi:hypothetical protein
LPVVLSSIGYRGHRLMTGRSNVLRKLRMRAPEVTEVEVECKDVGSLTSQPINQPCHMQFHVSSSIVVNYVASRRVRGDADLHLQKQSCGLRCRLMIPYLCAALSSHREQTERTFVQIRASRPRSVFNAQWHHIETLFFRRLDTELVAWFRLT